MIAQRIAQFFPDYIRIDLLISTLLHELSPLVLQYPGVLYPLIFHTTAQSLLDIGGDPMHLGAELGGLAVLHKGRVAGRG
jgi:hypothetical protein